MKIRKYTNQIFIHYSEYQLYRHYAKQFKNYMQKQGIPNIPASGEKEYLHKWSVLGKKVEPYSYRLFSRYCGNNSRIIPEDIGHTIVEALLNPLRFRAYYEDKNTYEDYLNPSCLPKTLLRRINGGAILDANFLPVTCQPDNYLKDYTRVIVKPANDSCSGLRVMLFERQINDSWICSRTGQSLTYDFLKGYGKDIIVQEAMEQHPFMSQFNSTSVNTLRITTYRSVKNEEIIIPSAVIRIGKKGEIVDNGHAGGHFVGINPATGELGRYASDQYGTRTDKWNDIDFRLNQFCIPEWNKILNFAKYVGRANRHCRFLGLDIMLDSQGEPKLIEYNTNDFSFWLFMFSGYAVFGEYTEEVIEWCTHSKNG